MNERQKIRKRDTSDEKIINKRGKAYEGTNSDVLISMKNASKDNKRYRLLNPGFKSNSEITDKRQSIIESIFGEFKVDEDIILYEEYSSYDESDCSSAYPLKFAKVNYHIKFKKKLLEVFAICLFKLLIIINIEWKSKILRRERETSEEKIINKRGKTDGSTD